MKSVKEYYDSIGWTKQKGKYVDTLMFTSDKGMKYKDLGQIKIIHVNEIEMI